MGVFLMNRQRGRGSMKMGKKSVAFAATNVSIFTCVVTLFQDRCRFIEGNGNHCILCFERTLFFPIFCAFCYCGFDVPCFIGSFCFLLQISVEINSVKLLPAMNIRCWINSVGLACCEWQWHWKENYREQIECVRVSVCVCECLIRHKNYSCFLCFPCLFTLTLIISDSDISSASQSDVVIVVTMDYVWIFYNRSFEHIQCALIVALSTHSLSLCLSWFFVSFSFACLKNKSVSVMNLSPA